MPQTVILTNNSIPSDAVSITPLDGKLVLSFTIMVKRPLNPDGLSLQEYAQKVMEGVLPPLDRDTYHAHFSSLDEDVTLIETFAAKHNLTVDRHFSPGASVHLYGTVENINNAFGVDLQSVTNPTRTYISYNGSISIPSELNGIIEAVVGLDNEVSVTRNSVTSPGRVLNPNYSVGNITPLQAASAYGTPQLGSGGGGQTIAIISLGGGFTANNLNYSFARNGLTMPYPQVTTVTVSGPGNNPTGANAFGYNAEVVSDIICAGCAAPGARIVVYFANNDTQSIVNVWNAIVNDTVNSPNIISFSYGASEQYVGSTLPQVDNAIASAVVKGITVCAATGDYGQWPYDPAGPNRLFSTQGYVQYPASNPGVLAVGGTILQLNTSTGAYGVEEAWNEVTAASGGGVSRRFSVPLYQNQNVFLTNNPDGSVSGATGRAIPDVAAHADGGSNSYEFFIYDAANNDVNGNTLYGIGGTSVACPLMAGMIASFNSIAGGNVGYFNTFIYSNPQFTNDVTVGNSNIQVNGTYAGGYEATNGWDAVTGLGSVNWGNLFYTYTVSTLTNITVTNTSGQVLSLLPSFSESNLSYGVTVDNNVTSVIITPTAPVSNQTILVNGNAVASGTPVTINNLTVGPFNNIPVTVSSYNGQHTTNYVINITRTAYLSTDATLSDLYIAGTSSTQVSPVLIRLSPPFSSSVTQYVATASNSISLLGLNPSANDPGVHAIYVNGTQVTPNTFSGPIFALDTGSNRFAVVVVAGDLVSSKEYDFTVYRLTPSGSTNTNVTPITYDPVHWITTSSDLGTINSNNFNTSVIASGSDTRYTIIAGSPPPNISIFTTNTTCVISGSVSNYPYPYTGEFVIRAQSDLRARYVGTDYIADKTFKIKVAPMNPPVWSIQQPVVTPWIVLGGPADGLYIDRDFMSFKMNALPSIGGVYTITYALASGFGTLPNGLELNSNGLLSGIISTDIGLGYINTYTFAVAASDGYQATTQTFKLYVINANSSASTYASIGPAFEPLQAPEFIGRTDLGTFRDNSTQFIPVTAYDPIPWMGPVTYSYNTVTTTLPLGLSLDPTGFLSGYIPPTSTYLISYSIPIIAKKTSKLTGTTATTSTMFMMNIIRSDEDLITWVSTGSLNTITPGAPSEKIVEATHTEVQYPLVYSQVGGTLPRGLKLQGTGHITGITTQSGVFTATIVASTSSVYYNQSTWNQVVSLGVYQSAISPVKQFTLRVYEPSKFNIWKQGTSTEYIGTLTSIYNNIYVKPFLPIKQRSLYRNFITDTSIFVPSLMYRPDDANFGVQTDLRLYTNYGMFALNSTTNYVGNYGDDINGFKINGIQQGALYFSDVQTISAYDNDKNPIYDLVYVGIVDPTSLISKVRTYFSSNMFLVPEWVAKTHLSSLGQFVGLSFNRSLLPEWQRTAYNQGGAFLPAVVLCYALPGQGQKIVDRYKRSVANGGFKFNQINFTVDRLIVDQTRSSTASSYLLFGD